MIRNWSSFYFVGAHVLPLFVLFVGRHGLRLALLCYLILLAAAVFAMLRNHLVPLRPVPLRRRERQGEDG